MAELKPCPFCGGEAKFVVVRAAPNERPEGFIRCENMCCEQCFVRSEDVAEEEWNRRISDG